LEDKIAFIGAGMMGGAIIKSLIKGNYAGKITAVDVSSDKLKELEKIGVETSSDSRKAISEADIIFVVVKPYDVERVLRDNCEEIKGKILVSAAAALPLKYLIERAPESRVVRIMPNLCVMAQAAYTAFCCGDNVTVEDKKKITELLNMMGICNEVEEKHLAAITAMSGSGPGYMSIIVEALEYAGLKVGLPRNIALACAAQTVMGTAKLILDLNEEPAKIRDMTTTPGGTTIETIYQIEKSQIRTAMVKAIEKGTKKSQTILEKLEIK